MKKGIYANKKQKKMAGKLSRDWYFSIPHVELPDGTQLDFCEKCRRWVKAQFTAVDEENNIVCAVCAGLIAGF